jgi:hypothetical protein
MRSIFLAANLIIAGIAGSASLVSEFRIADARPERFPALETAAGVVFSPTVRRLSLLWGGASGDIAQGLVPILQIKLMSESRDVSNDSVPIADNPTTPRKPLLADNPTTPRKPLLADSPTHVRKPLFA